MEAGLAVHVIIFEVIAEPNRAEMPCTALLHRLRVSPAANSLRSAALVVP